ncbi:probable glutathione S-transferase [Mangifera indica]|uniref:probable glutathione S-transferase n=1 Tax=Mangifera indica TaxID=29780 RepID=UPI001CFA8FBF|nr:probable glutathione S-transferase [Mangifera indica]
MATQVKLLGFWVSPFVFRVIWALKLKGVDYEYLEEDIFNKSARLQELNPVHKKVPILLHDNKVVCESFVILEYVDETWEQNPLLPKDPYERAIARFWAKFAEEKLFYAAWTAMWSKGEMKEKAVKESIEALEKIEGEVKEKKLFEGESIGYLDLAIGWIAYWLPVWEEVGAVQILSPNKFPAVTAWMAKILSHPVIKDNLPPRDRMHVYFEGRRDAIYNHFNPKPEDN